MQKIFFPTQTLRTVSDHGETLVVRKVQGVNTLTDICNENQTVGVPLGRKAKLVRFSFGISVAGRDALTVVSNRLGKIGFASVERSSLVVLLEQLSEGQLVDVLPAAEPCFAYARLGRPSPVFFGAAHVEFPIYAYDQVAA